nr:ABC transporter substrate-binding protein [Bradyrhizobium jicamae]
MRSCWAAPERPGALPVIALSERGYKGPLYGNHGMISADFLRLAGKSAEGIICPTGPVTAAEQLPESNPIRKVALAFRAAYEKANGEPPSDAFSPYAFDGWLVFMDAARRAKATGAVPGTQGFRNALREALFATRDVVGTHGIYSYTPADRHGVDDRARILVQIENGKYKLLP